jgi:hypothetical protein
MRWFETMPDRWLNEQRLAERIMEDTIAFIDAEGRAVLRGKYRSLSEHGHEQGVFAIRIVYPHRFPSRNCGPFVYLESHHDEWMNGRDSHIEADWRLCLYVPLESGIRFERNDALAHLFESVHTFLIRERIYQRDLRRAKVSGVQAEWPGPDRSHGDRGLIEAMREHGKPGRNDACVCGSGLKFKKCCLTRLTKR